MIATADPLEHELPLERNSRVLTRPLSTVLLRSSPGAHLYSHHSVLEAPVVHAFRSSLPLSCHTEWSMPDDRVESLDT